MTKKLPDVFIFDVETGGLEPGGNQGSSILSASFSSGNNLVKEAFAYPEPGTWLSEFSKQNIMPQVRGASQTHSEKGLIQHFIKGLQESPAGMPLVGFNIENFDLPFLRSRAEEQGLGKEFKSATKGRRVIDVGLRSKMILGETISEHIQAGTFKEQLGGKSWGQAQVAYEGLPYESRPPEYRMLKQMESFHKKVDSSGYQAVIDKQARGWRLEQLFPLIDSDSELVSKAHQSSADVQMTRRLYESIGTGEFRAKAKTPEFAKAWLSSTVAGLKAAPGPVEKAAGEVFHPSFQTKVRSAISKVPQPVRRLAAGGAVLGAGLMALSAASSLFSGRDDDYNVIEGLSHRGISSGMRKDMTDFGSGYKGDSGEKDKNKSRPLTLNETRATLLAMAGVGVGATLFGLMSAKKLFMGEQGISNLAQKGEWGKVIDSTLDNIEDVLGIPVGLGMTAGASLGFISTFKSNTNAVTGLSHKGIAKDKRKELTDFSSPVNLAKAATRAEKLYEPVNLGRATARAGELYKSKIQSLLGDRKLNWMDVVDEGQVTLLAKDQNTGEALMAISRDFMQGEVHLTSVEVSKSLRGTGIGKQFYQAEGDILREAGFGASTKITSPVSSPITARWQMQQYGSTVDAEHAGRIGDLGDFQKRILSKSVQKEQMPGITMTGTLGYSPMSMIQQKSIAPTKQGIDLRHTAQRAKQIETSPVTGDRKAHNKIEGMQEGGIGAWFRKKFTDFGSPADLFKATSRAAELYGKNVDDVLKFAGLRKGEYKISNFISHAKGHHSLNVKAVDLKGNELASISRKFSEGSIELQSIQIGSELRGIGAGRLLYESELDIFRKMGYSAGEQVVSPSVISPITARMQMQMYGSKVEGGMFDDAAEMTNRIMSKQMDTSSFMHVELVGRLPPERLPAAGAAMAAGAAGELATKFAKSESLKTNRVQRGKMNTTASAVMSKAGRDGGRRSRMG